jgi:hypothetical protein
VAALFDSRGLGEIAERCIEHGRTWRRASRRLVELARPIPMEDEQYEDWFARHGRELDQGLVELSAQFEGFADLETRLFGDLRRVVSNLA